MKTQSKGVFPGAVVHRPKSTGAHSRCTPTPPILTPSVEAADISSDEILLSNSCSDREEGLSDTPAGGKHSPKMLLSEDNTESKLSANKHYVEKLW